MTAMHQPSYFPWQGLLNKMQESQTFILLDDVQFHNGAYQNRNLFLDNRAQVQILTIAIVKKNYLHKSIKELLIADSRWQSKHLKFLMQNYSKHPYYEEIMPDITPLYEKKQKYLIDAVLESMLVCKKLFKIETKLLRQSEIETTKGMKKNECIIELLQKTDAKHYLSGLGAKAYQDEKLFAQNGLNLSYQNYKPKPYPQHKNDSFQAGLSSLDLLFNVGVQEAYKYIRAENE